MEEQEDTEEDQFFFNHAPRMPDDDIITSEVAILTGGRDQHGRAIIAFPAKYHGILESKVKASGMETLLRYFIDITRTADRKRGFAFVTDLRFSTLDFVLLLKSTLNSVQAEMKGAIGTCVLYVILPLNKKTHKNTLTHLALRQSKKKINKSIIPPYFQCVAVMDEVELYNYIEKSHLTPDLEGYLHYSHQDWVTFRRIVEPFFANFESVQVRLPSAYQRLTAMGNVTIRNNKEQLQETHSQLQDAYNEIERSLHLDQVLQQCKELLPRFSSCEEEDVFAILAQKPIFKETKETVERCYEILTTARKKISDDWNEMSRRLTQAAQLLEYRADVNKVLDWYRKERDLQHDVEIADSLSRAEMLCTHYETGLIVKAEEKLSRAGALVQRGEALAVDDGNRNVGDIMALARSLEEESQDFQNAVQKRQQILQSIYHFHQLYIKARHWYVRCIRFLPPNLQDLFYDLNSGHHDDRALRLQWGEDVRRFLHKHPLLEREELKKIKTIPEDVGANILKRKGRLLSYRCLKLTDLLSHNGKTSSANIKDMMKWRSEIRNQSDDMSSNQSDILPSSAQMRKSPSDSSLDTSQESQRRKKPDSKRQSKTGLKNRTIERDDTYPRSKQSQDRAKRHNRQRDRYSDTNSNTVNETDSEDPLITRVGNAASFYNQQRGAPGLAQNDGRDGINGGKQVGTKRSRSSEMLYNLAHGHAQPPTPLQHDTPAHSPYLKAGPLPSRQSAVEHAQTYGIYGDSEFEDDTAVVIHHQGPSHLPQGLPQDMLPGNQVHSQGSLQPGNVMMMASPDPSNISSRNQSSYGLIQQDPNNPQHDFRTDLEMTPSTQLSPHIGNPRHGSVHQDDTPANLNTNNSNYPPSSQSNHTLPSNHPHPSSSSLQRSNGLTLSKQAPMSFHGSLMNIHQSPMPNDIPHSFGGTENVEPFNSSPVSRHRSMVDLSQSPITDHASNAHYMQASPPRTYQQQVNTPQTTGDTSYTSVNGESHPLRHDTATSRLQHGISEPNVNASPYNDSSPYRDILDSLTNLRGRMNSTPTHSTVRFSSTSHPKKATHSPSQEALSRSAMDLRYMPQNTDTTSNGLSYSERSLHRSDFNAQHNVSAARSMILPTQNVSPVGGPADPQAEYYKKLYSTSTPNRSTSASGHRNSDHTLDPSMHTWMHDIPPPRTKHQSLLFARIRQTSRPLSPLSLLEMEVARETRNAQEARHEDEYSAEQSRRQAVINDILDQSPTRTRSHHTLRNDQRINLPEQENLSNGYKDHRSKKRRKQGTNGLLNSKQKNDQQINSKSSSEGFSSAQPRTKKSRFQKGSLMSGNGFREGHLGLAESNGHGVAPASVQRQSINAQRDLSNTERQLGLSTTLPQPAAQEQTITAAERIQNQNLVSDPRLAHSSFANGVSSEELLSVSPGEKLDSEGDWRQKHLRELGLSPASGLPAGRYGMNEGLTPSKTTSPSVSSTNWQHQHLQDLGVSHAVLPASLRQHSTIKAIPASLPKASNGDWRSQHLLELGLSPIMHQSGISQDLTTAEPPARLSSSNKDEWKHHHSMELGASNNVDHSATLLVGVNRKLTGSNGGPGSDWRLNHLKDLGISPRTHQYPAPRSSTSPAGHAGRIAPVTSKLRGVIGSGRSLNDMEEVHRLADDTTKKSVRFAHLSGDGILDAEEEAQDELELRLFELELKLQEEENALNHQHVLDEEELILDQQLRDLDHREGRMQVHWSDPQSGHEVMVEGTVHQSTHNQQKRASAWSGQVLPEGDVKLTHTQNGQYVHVNTHPNHQVLVESAIQPTHVQSHQHINLENVLEGSGPVKPVKTVPQEKETRSRSRSSNTEIAAPNHRTPSQHPSQHHHTPEASHHAGKTASSDKAKIQSHSKPSQDNAEPDQVVIHSSVERTNVESQENSSNDINLELRMSQLTGVGGSPTTSNSHLPESQLHAKKLSKQFSLPKDDIAEEINLTSLNEEDNFQTPSGIQVKNQGAVKKGDHTLEDLNKITNENQKAPETTINDPIHQILDGSRDPNHEVEDDKVYQVDGLLPHDDIRGASFSERDHTAADYIACALGMEFVNDKSDLTVQPFSDSKNSTSQQHNDRHLNKIEDLDYSQAQQSIVEGSSPQQEDNVNVEAFKHPRVKLPSSSASLQEGPCSPIRQWLKEKETMETDEGLSNQSEMDLTGKIHGQQTRPDVANPKVEILSNDSSLTQSSKRTSPIREWLREKQAKEAHESSLIHQSLTALESPIDSPLTLDTDEVSPGRMSKQESPSNSRRRTNSLIPVLVDSGRTSNVGKRETPSQLGARRRSSSSIPVYKGLSKSSPPRTKESPTVTSSFNSHEYHTGVDQASHETMKKHDFSSKKGNSYSKIPVSKVFSALKDGGYLESTKQSSPQVSAIKKQSKPTVGQTKDARPELEKQGTFTKETKPTLTRDGTFTIESEEGDDLGRMQEAVEGKAANQGPLSPLALVFDHMVKKGGVTTSRKREAPTTHAQKKRHDSVEETFENSSTESSMSPTSRSVVMTSKTPTTNLYSTKNIYVNAQNGISKDQDEVAQAKSHSSAFEGLTESDRIDHSDMDDNELEKMMATKSQLAEIRNLEIENRHLAYERKEFEAQYIKSMQKRKQPADTFDEA